MPMNGGSVPAFSPAATSARGGRGVAILLGIHTVAIAVLEIDAEVFDRFAAEFFNDPRTDRCRVNVRGETERRRKRFGVRGVLVEHGQCDRTELRRRISLEQVRSAVDGVHRLPIGTLAGKVPRHALIDAPERGAGSDLVSCAFALSRGHRIQVLIVDIIARNKI